jgi:hypothetical protein
MASVLRAAIIGIALLGLIFLIGLPFLMHAHDPQIYAPMPLKAAPANRDRVP